MMTEKMITLNNGVEIPQLALGTWIVDDNKVAEPVKTAIRLGYRHPSANITQHRRLAHLW